MIISANVVGGAAAAASVAVDEVVGIRAHGCHGDVEAGRKAASG